MARSKKTAPPPPLSPPSTPQTIDQMDFDSLEEKIRGEEILNDAEVRRHKESREVKKKLDQYELDRRLEELKKKINGK